MARKTKIQIAAESALTNLNGIHELASDNPDGAHATYLRNANDCERWCKAVRDARLDYPAWMIAGNIKYFAAIWHLPS
jgi:hypothetical protein